MHLELIDARPRARQTADMAGVSRSLWFNDSRQYAYFTSFDHLRLTASSATPHNALMSPFHLLLLHPSLHAASSSSISLGAPFSFPPLRKVETISFFSHAVPVLHVVCCYERCLTALYTVHRCHLIIFRFYRASN